MPCQMQATRKPPAFPGFTGAQPDSHTTNWSGTPTNLLPCTAGPVARRRDSRQRNPPHDDVGGGFADGYFDRHTAVWIREGPVPPPGRSDSVSYTRGGLSRWPAISSRLRSAGR